MSQNDSVWLKTRPKLSPFVCALAVAISASLSAGTASPASDLFQNSISWLPKDVGAPHSLPSAVTMSAAAGTKLALSTTLSSGRIRSAAVNGPTWSATVQRSSGASPARLAVWKSSRSASTSLFTTSIVTLAWRTL